jgi:predicted nucleic acid-binding protein
MLFDTSVWVEYFLATEKGGRVAQMLKRDAAIFVCPMTYAEISSWANKNGHAPGPFIKKMKELSNTLELDEELLVFSGRFYADQRNKSKKISLIDCVIYISAAIHGLTLLTCDYDFSGLPGAEIL